MKNLGHQFDAVATTTIETDPICNLIRSIQSFQPNPSYPHDSVVLEALKEAAMAGAEGNYGIGAVIVDSNGNVIARGHNRVFQPRHNSSKHAEMDVLDVYEELCHEQGRSSKGDVLITSLEPCPMCLSRIITSQINTVYYAADDELGGMVHLLHLMPAVWQNIAAAQHLRARIANCSPELTEMAKQAFEVTREMLDAKLAEG